MKTFIIVCSLFLMTGLAACGGASSNDATEELTFTATDAHNVGAGFYNSQSAAFTAIVSQYTTEAAKSDKSLAIDLTKTTKSGTIPVNDVYNCQVGGHITSTGNFNWSVTVPDPPAEASAWIRGQLMQQVSDPTNNLYDCEQTGGVILDGTIYSQFTYDWTESGGAKAVFSTDGTIGINKRGPTGGLVMIASDCSIFFTVAVNVSPLGTATGNASGTICGESYSFSY